MRLLAIVHKYPPLHNAGAEWMLHAIFKRLIDHGHEATVVFENAPTYRYEGVLVTATPSRELRSLARDHDVIVTHLDNTGLAVRTAQTADRPLVHLVHNDRQLQFHRVRPAPNVLIVSNSEWLDEAVAWPGDRIICRPPVFVADYATDTTREVATLINVTSAKGASTFYDLARSMPARPFLGVVGAYGVPDRRSARKLRNVELIENTPNIVNDVYARTRVVLMPSAYESWGRVAVEAACSGIPTIAAPTPGLVEALGSAGLFVEPRDLKRYRGYLERLFDDADFYAERSARARERADELERITDADLDALEARIKALIETHRAERGAAYHQADDMGILSSITAGHTCPICHAGGCSCKPDPDALNRGGLNVRVRDAVDHRGPKNVWRTFRGDFRYSDAEAIRQGLLPDPESSTLPRIVARRLRAVVSTETLEDLEAAYAAAGDDERAAFLAGVALLKPRALAQAAADLEKALAGGKGRAKKTKPEDAGDDELDAIINLRVGAVLAWANTTERAKAALTAEVAGKNRPGLVAELELRAKAED